MTESIQRGGVYLITVGTYADPQVPYMNSKANTALYSWQILGTPRSSILLFSVR